MKIELDEKIMYEQLELKTTTQNWFIKNKMQFIQSLIKQWKLKMEFKIIYSKNNITNN